MRDPWFMFTLDGPRSSWESEVVAGLRFSAHRLAEWGVQEDHTQVWQHTRGDGTDWLLAHVDLIRANAIPKTLRVDLDAAGFRGGWSPAGLNWDSGVPAEDAGVEMSPPEGTARSMTDEDPNALGRAAADWIVGAVARWSGGS